MMIKIRSRSYPPVLLLLALLLALGLAACGGDDDEASDETTEEGAAADGAEEGAGEGAATGTLRLGYFPNVTHAPAIVGVEEGLFAAALGEGVELELITFNSGTEVIEALFAEEIDVSFIGPNPAINGFAQSEGAALRIISGTTSGGASLVVREGIDSPEDLAGTTLATPSLGNTQDVALRAWLADQGYTTDTTGGGDVSIRPQDNADTLATFINGDIAGAWVPEPWATRLVLEGDGKVLLDERELWPDGEFVTTHVIAATDYLADNPAIIEALLGGLLDSLEFIEANPDEARTITNDGIERVTTSRLADETIAGAWENLTFTYDPVPASLEGSKEDAVAVGLLEEVDLEGIYDLTILNEILADRGLEAVGS